MRSRKPPWKVAVIDGTIVAIITTIVVMVVNALNGGGFFTIFTWYPFWERLFFLVILAVLMSYLGARRANTQGYALYPIVRSRLTLILTPLGSVGVGVIFTLLHHEPFITIFALGSQTSPCVALMSWRWTGVYHSRFRLLPLIKKWEQ